MQDMYRLHIVRDLRAADMRRATNKRQARLAAHAHEARALQARRGAPAPVRRALGRSLIKLGERIAAEPALRPARSR
jgi:hypothetical protein